MEQTDPKLFDWLVVVFLHEIENNKVYGEQMKDEILNAGSSKNIALFLIQDSVSTTSDDSGPDSQPYLSKLEQAQNAKWIFKPLGKHHQNGEANKKRCWEKAFQYIYSHYTG